MLDVKQLRVLKAVSEHGSFSAAAESLSYTQPAVSQQIAALERQATTPRSWTAAAAACASPSRAARSSSTRRW